VKNEFKVIFMYYLYYKLLSLSMKNSFDYTSRDTQATIVKELPPERFDPDKYSEYEASLFDSCKKFIVSNSGVAVYRRMRVAEVFSDGCSNMKRSLELQLGGLEKSMENMMDIPNFLEPWYGIGTAASAYGMDYIWNNRKYMKVSTIIA
jgi:hypothetical protein